MTRIALGLALLLASGCTTSTGRYIVTELPLAIGVQPNLKPLCIALDPADSRGVWWWEGGADCSTRSTSDVFRGDRGTVSSQGATTTASFQLGLIGDPRRGDPMSQSVSVALTDGRLRSVATGSEQRTVRRAELSIPLLVGR